MRIQTFSFVTEKQEKKYLERKKKIKKFFEALKKGKLGVVVYKKYYK